MKKILTIFIAGISTLLPIFLTIYILYTAFVFIDNLAANLIAQYLGYQIVGLGFIATIAFIFIVGLFTKNIIGKYLIRLTSKIFEKIPIAQNIYKAIHEISNSLFNKEKNSFKQPVMVEFPSKGFKSIGFLTNDSVIVNSEENVFVFIPTTPNPTNGFLITVKIEDVTLLDISVDEAMKTIISMGVISPSRLN